MPEFIMNRGPRVVDTREGAEKTFEVFHARPHRRHVPFKFGWPDKIQEIGQGRSQIYRSNKWKMNLRDYEEYKHVAEAWQTLYVTPGFLRDWWTPTKKIEVYGPMVRFKEPMPQHFTILAPLLGVQISLFDKSGRIPKNEKQRRIYEVTVAHGMLGAAEHPSDGSLILFVYTNKGGVHMVFGGPELAIGKDGIEG